MSNPSYRLIGAINPRGLFPAICIPVFSAPTDNNTYTQYIGIQGLIIAFEQIEPNDWERALTTSKDTLMSVKDSALYCVAWSEKPRDWSIDTIEEVRANLINKRWIVDQVKNPFERLDFAQVSNQYDWFAETASQCEQALNDEIEIQAWLCEVLLLSRVRYAVDSVLISRSTPARIRRRVCSRLTPGDPETLVHSIRLLLSSFEAIQTLPSDFSHMEEFISTDVTCRYVRNRLFASNPVQPASPARWYKKLTDSDAQRKLSGNQRGSITLTRAGFPINPQTYFRYDFFSSADWVSGKTRTGKHLETTSISMSTNILGEELGLLSYNVTYADNRQARQNNYTSLLHLGPLAPFFEGRNMSGSWISLERRIDSRFYLTITDTEPK